MKSPIKNEHWWSPKTLIYILLVYFLFLLPSFCAPAYIPEAGVGYVLSSVVFILPLVLLLIFAARSWVALAILGGILGFAVAIDIFTISVYHSFIVTGNIISTFVTDSTESSEFMHYNAWALWGLIVTIIIIAFLFALRRHVPKLSCKHWLIGECISIALIIIVLACSNQHILDRPPYNFFYQSYNGIYWRVQQEQCIPEQLPEDSVWTSIEARDNTKKEIYFLVIGESLRYKSCSFDGQYERNTTPQLKEAVENQQLLSLTDYYSTATMTIFSMPQLLTPATPENFTLSYTQPTIFQYFKHAGFKTYAIAERPTYESMPHLVADIDSVILYDYEVDNQPQVRGDMLTAQIVDSLCAAEDKLFFVIKLHGNHTYYSNFSRDCNIYTPNLFNFSAEDLKRKDLFVNSYDNTVRYMDKVITAILANIDAHNAVSAGFFLSDHGEQLFSKGGGHGVVCNPPKEEYHVPCLFYHSKAYEEVYPEHIEQVKKHAQEAICGDNIYHSLLGLAELNSSSYDAGYNIFSPEFVLHQRYLLQPDFVNYHAIE